VLAALLCGGAAIACGGQVVFEEPNDGGSGGSGTTGPGVTKATTGTKSTTGTQVSTASSGGCSVPSLTPTDCKQACTIVYVCGQTFCGENQQLCPNFSPSITTMDEFLVGCMDVCQNQMALIQVADADNCDVTIETLQGSVPGFVQACGGF
jgi:hypothetical protein